LATLATLATTATSANGLSGINSNISSAVQTGTISSMLAQDTNASLYRYTKGAVATFISGQSMNISGSATNATFASSATNATFASSSTNASAATNASFASSATNASFATNSTTATKLSTAGGSAGSYSARAWASFSGFSGSVRGSGNVSSVSRNTTGDYTMNFSTAMQDANYAAWGSTGTESGSCFICPQSTANSASGWRFNAIDRNISFGTRDQTNVSAEVIR
jgi:hypothetical protein